MSKSVLLFPGQGSQEPEMAETVAKLRPDLAERANAVVGEDPFARVADGTRFAQPAIFCAAIAGL
ncbi:MAG: [acyl-carrier-protein] S-malonyltransferase, partial [Actinomycetota bacterium]|nr:[acyl-carrier-protein] S-malonyltransferase [Actinomycetota bacterium]